MYDPPERDSTEIFNTTKSSSSETIESSYAEKTPMVFQAESPEDHVGGGSQSD